jgi:mRNA-degrading endonuclease RelE of RelBE toxin-antitoxin system
MFYTIEYLEKVAQYDIPTLSTSDRECIKRAIEECLATNLIALEKPKFYALNGQRQLRAGSYRAIYQVDYENQIVTINTIGHRSRAYD